LAAAVGAGHHVEPAQRQLEFVQRAVVGDRQGVQHRSGPGRRTSASLPRPRLNGCAAGRGPHQRPHARPFKQWITLSCGRESSCRPGTPGLSASGDPPADLPLPLQRGRRRTFALRREPRPHAPRQDAVQDSFKERNDEDR
ncbi:hypothetical protein CATMIT_01685, partial [Catenibacterium mitsuokai DSM 15897]